MMVASIMPDWLCRDGTDTLFNTQYNISRCFMLNHDLRLKSVLISLLEVIRYLFTLGTELGST